MIAVSRYAADLFTFFLHRCRADPWVGLGRGKPGPYIGNIKGEALA
jgi:hypothetical protein